MAMQTNSPSSSPSPKKRRKTPKKGAKKANGGAAPEAADMDVSISGDGDPGAMPSFDGSSIIIPHEDGEVTVDLNPQAEESKKGSDKFGDNLAEFLDEGILGEIANDLLEAISEDERGREEWLTQRAEGIDLLGIKIEKPGGGISSSSAPVDGQSRVRDPVMLDAVLRAQANAYAELCPSEGPCKVVNYGSESTQNDKLAEDFEKDFNFYLTGSAPGTATEYYEDTRSMLGMTVYASGMFKKVYSCPLRRRPVSESVDGEHLLVPANATDLGNAGRVTHQIEMRQSTMRRMQILGVYRDIDLIKPTPMPSILDTKKADVAGLQTTNMREDDLMYTVYESYCELDIPGFEHKEKGKITGLPLPYRVTLDRDSRVILEIRRNWKEEDEDLQAKIPFVAFPYVKAGFTGFYGIGLLHILGNATLALTAMLREGIDAGMFANFPGGMIAKQNTRQLNNEIRISPGALAPIDIGSMPSIRDAIMMNPYKDVTPGLMGMMQMLIERASRLGGAAEAPIGEGKQDAPVGTTLALIEQATKIEGGVHKALHAAQREELRLLKELFREDPEALWRGNRRPAMGGTEDERVKRFQEALENFELTPASDPNVPSHMHRLAKAQSLLQMAMTMPGVFNPQVVATRACAMMKIDDVQAMLAPPQQPQPDPMAQAMLALKGREVGVKEQALALKAQSDHANLASKENIASMQIGEKAHSAQLNAQTRLATSAQGAQGQQGPQFDPMQARALDLKQQQIDQSGAKMHLDAHNAHADREAKTTVEAMKIAQSLAVHPLSDQIVDEQLQQMSPFMTPPNQSQGGAKDGGAVADKPQPHEPRNGRGMSQEEVDRIVNALDLARTVKDYSGHLH